MNRAAHLKRDRWISLGVFVAIVVIWQILSVLYPAEAAPGEPMVAGWQVLFTKTFLSMADYWEGGWFGVPSVADGADRTYLAAALSLADHSLQTILRLVCGLVAGGVLGLLLGIAVSWSRWTRRMVDLPVQFLRTLPLRRPSTLTARSIRALLSHCGGTTAKLFETLIDLGIDAIQVGEERITADMVNEFIGRPGTG